MLLFGGFLYVLRFDRVVTKVCLTVRLFDVMGAARGVGVAYPSGAEHKMSLPVFVGVYIAGLLIFLM